MSSLKGNKKVAKSRGSDWKKKLVEGKLDAGLYPTILKQKRVEKGVSQEAIAKEIKLGLATYGGIERARVPVKLMTATFLANFFKTDIDKMFKIVDKETGKYLAIKLK